jgi:2-isopropylmalate synthase
MRPKERIYLYDTTLRDGAQTPGIDFSLEEKKTIARMLDDLGIDYIEGGYPGANPTDTALFSTAHGLSAKFTAFGMTRRPGRSASNDPGLQQLLQAKADALCFVAKAWHYHVEVALGCSLEENLQAIRDSVNAARAKGFEVLVDLEHFFDGFKANEGYAMACAVTAFEAGARWIVLCDTNGGSMPEEIERIVFSVSNIVPGENLGIHCHNDTGMAVANSLAAVRAGARMIQGTLNGIGERCGNANLITLIPTLALKDIYASRFSLGLKEGALEKLTQVSRAFNEILNRPPEQQAPYVGETAFATKAGIHASAILKNPDTYEHVPPEKVGNVRHVLVSDQAGRSNLRAQLARFGLEVKEEEKLSALLAEIKEREAQGYAFDTAEASLELLVRRFLGLVPEYFDVESYKVLVERRYNARGELVTMAEAIVKVCIDGEQFMSVAEGNGPVHALDAALRKDLGPYSEYLKDLELVDYKVRIVNTGTDATTRVLIEWKDGSGARWFTVGVSPNIIDASFQAMLDAIFYRLLKNGLGDKMAAE